MRAVVLSRQGRAEENLLHGKEIAKPVPGRNEICIKVIVCGVCRTDLHIVENELPLKKSPIVPGHQVIGIVSDTGKGARRFRKGDRVGVTWINSTCGKCRYCRSGMENLCDSICFTGWDANGGYAEYMAVSQDYAFRLPRNFDASHAAPLFCAGIIGYRGFKLSAVKPGETLAIYGFGSSAYIITQIARHYGCNVLAYTRGGEHKTLAKRIGARVLDINDTSKRADAVIITAPAGELVPNALDVLRKGGRIAIIGIHMSRIPEIDYDTMLYGERSITSVTNYTRADALEFLKLAAEMPIRTSVQTFKLEEANKALIMLKHGQLDVSGVLKI